MAKSRDLLRDHCQAGTGSQVSCLLAQTCPHSERHSCAARPAGPRELLSACLMLTTASRRLRVVSYYSFWSPSTGTALWGHLLPCPQPRWGLEKPNTFIEERQVSPRQGKESCLGPCLLSKMSQQRQRLASVGCCVPDHSTLQGCTCWLPGAAPPCPPLSLPACPSPFLSASRFLPAPPQEAHQILGLGTMHPHSPLASQGLQNYLERGRDGEHSSGFWDGAAPGLGREGYVQRGLRGGRSGLALRQTDQDQLPTRTQSHVKGPKLWRFGLPT